MPTADDVKACPLLARHLASLSTLETGLSGIVLLLRDAVVETANAFAGQFPEARIDVLGTKYLGPDDLARLGPSITFVLTRSQRARLDYLMKIPRPQAMIDAGNLKRAHKLSSYRHLSYFVDPGGLFIIDELDLASRPQYDDGQGETFRQILGEVVTQMAGQREGATAPRAFVAELAHSTASIDIDHSRAVIRRAGEPQLFKLRGWQANDVLTARYGSGWGTVVEERPPFDFTSNALVTSHGDGPIPDGQRVFTVPPRYLRRYEGAVCSARQVVAYGDYALPDTWRHPHQRVLKHRQLVPSSPFFGRHLDATRPTTVTAAEGAYYYLDTELPGHFGHVTTEVLSRVWAWNRARADHPDLRPLISVRTPNAEVPLFQRQIFDALRIPLDQALVLGPRDAVEVEFLYGPTPQMENPQYVDPQLAEVWAEVGSRLPVGAPARDDKIFVSRRPSDNRPCHQTHDVERFFAGLGFRILFPEDHSYLDQKMIFSRARIIAGFGGSGMFNMMFAPDALVILLSGHSYNAENEHLIAAANGNRVHYFWGQSELEMPADGHFSVAAFRSAWTFDLRRHKRELRKLVR